MNKSNILKVILIFASIFLISFIPHFTNMFNYPYYENDEGTYMSQAWSLITSGKLAPYTYWYDHAPAGWVLIALWVKLTNGFFTFGTSVNSGRVLMLVIHIISSFLLYFITKKTTKSAMAGIIAVCLFSFTPLGIYFQRRVLLDNIMIFWVLISTALLLYKGNNLKILIASALSFGIAVLTKENAVFFMPVLVYLVYLKSTKYQKEFFIGKWLFIAISIISTYFLYALLKGEFFPVGFGGDHSDRVSLITTLKNQYSRGEPIPFWNSNSYFYSHFSGWNSKDPILMTFGLIATFINLIIGITKKSFGVPSLLSFMFLVFLARGKLVIDFYVVPLIPLFALNISILVSWIVEKLSMGRGVLKFILFGIFISIFVIIQNLDSQVVYTKNETASQVEAISWIKQNLNEDDKFIIDDAIFVDLHAPRFPGDKVFPNGDWFWKAEEDPEIFAGKLNEDWLNIKYLILSHEMLKQIRDGEFKFIKKALVNSDTIQMWRSNSTSYIDIPNYISTNGDWMAVQKISDKNSVLLDKSWNYYKSNFIKGYGQVVDKQTKKTTSEGQSYAMLRSVWVGDKNTFDNVWTWTKDHLQFRVQDNLISWLWLDDDNGGKLGDFESASDADGDIALSLLLAYKKWGDVNYLDSAKKLIDDIWDKEVVEINGRYYLISGPGAKRDDGYLVNPSYLAPASYKIFAKVDTKHDWNGLSLDSYYLLNKLADESKTGLPPNWVLIDNTTGEIKSPNNYISDPSASWYGYDAFRVMFRVALDERWFGDTRSTAYLKRVQPFFEKETKDRFFAVYSPDGVARVDYQQLSITTSAYFAMNKINKELANSFYYAEIEGQFDFDGGFYNDGKNYYDQNWAWFATAFQYDLLENYFK